MIEPIKLGQSQLADELRALVERFGQQSVSDQLRVMLAGETNNTILTIVCNLGPHPLPTEIVRGELYVASEGSLDFGSPTSVQLAIHQVLRKVSIKVKSKQWSQIYIVPFGPVTLAMQIKMLCYRILGIETIDWFYHSSIGYFPLQVSTRDVVVNANNGP